jgi:hypothetical protein
MRFHVPDRIAGAYLIALVASAACVPQAPPENWKCDLDSSVGRPLSDRDAAYDDGGDLPTSVCMDTCGPPVSKCTRILLDSGVPGALCPFCTF